MPEDQKEAYKQAAKEAIREWLDAQFAALGKWTAGGVAALALATLLYLILTTHGWRPPH